MKAADIMTTEVVSVGPDTRVKEIARLLLEHGISAVPVVDAAGAVVGMVSEGGLTGRSAREREARRSWWLNLLTEGHDVAPEFDQYLKAQCERAKDVMTRKVIWVTDTTPLPEIAERLETHRIKRVPVLRDGKLVGVVSRADLLHATTQAA
jgi:CBS domain-containing protein